MAGARLVLLLRIALTLALALVTSSVVLSAASADGCAYAGSQGLCILSHGDGDPQCPEAETQYYGYDWVYAWLNAPQSAFVQAYGEEYCHTYDGNEYETTRVYAGLYTDGVVYAAAEVDWYAWESDGSGDCYLYTWAATADEFMSHYGGCPAGSPPRPPWGTVFP